MPTSKASQTLQQLVESGQRTIKLNNDDGEPFPDFLLDHIADQWAEVQLDFIDPDVCLRVDSGLSYCGCGKPGNKLRQFIYLYHASEDFDYQTIELMVRIAGAVTDDSPIWDEVLALELNRDCGMARDDYLAMLRSIADHVDAESTLCETLLSA